MPPSRNEIIDRYLCMRFLLLFQRSLRTQTMKALIAVIFHFMRKWLHPPPASTEFFLSASFHYDPYGVSGVRWKSCLIANILNFTRIEMRGVWSLDFSQFKIFVYFPYIFISGIYIGYNENANLAEVQPQTRTRIRHSFVKFIYFKGISFANNNINAYTFTGTNYLYRKKRLHLASWYLNHWMHGLCII